MNDKVESTTLLCFYQNEIIEEMKASLDANFHNVLNLSSSINGHVLSQNRRIVQAWERTPNPFWFQHGERKESGKEMANKTARVKWWRGKREANGK